jgi:hypothetical protein
VVVLCVCGSRGRIGPRNGRGRPFRVYSLAAGDIIEPPRSVKDAITFSSEVIKKTRREVKPAVRTSHTLDKNALMKEIITRHRTHFVHDGSLGGFPPIQNSNGLEAMRTRVTSTILGDVEGDNLVIK